MAIRRTLERRPELLDAAVLDDEQQALLDEILREGERES
jgi:tRNA G37 N-methylase TrmD